MANDLMQGGASVMLKKSKPTNADKRDALDRADLARAANLGKKKPDRYQERAQEFDDKGDTFGYGPLSSREIDEE